MFGQGYKRMESDPIADDGCYDVKIVSVQQKNTNGYNFLEFGFTFQNGKVMLPKSFALFENRPEQGQKGYEDFCKRATRIFDCFDLNAAFDEKTIASWVGHVGKVEIGKDSKGFAVVKKFFPCLAAQNKAAERNAPTLGGTRENPFVR